MDGDFNNAARAIMCALGRSLEGKLTPLQIMNSARLSQEAFATGKASAAEQGYVRSEGLFCSLTEEGTIALFGQPAAPAPASQKASCRWPPSVG